MTRPELNTQISTILNNNVADESVSPEMEANAIKLVADYVDGLITTNLYGTFSDESDTVPYPELPNDINYLLSSGGTKVSLPITDKVGKMVIIITGFAIQLYARPDGTGEFVNATSNNGAGSVNLLVNNMYRFTYLGFHNSSHCWAGELIGL